LVTIFLKIFFFIHSFLKFLKKFSNIHPIMHHLIWLLSSSLVLVLQLKFNYASEQISFRVSRERRQLPSEINIQVTAPLFTARLYDFGPSEGDQSLPKQFDNAHYSNGLKLRLSRPIHFYGQWFETIFIHPNGIIGFEENFPNTESHSSIFNMNKAFIAPFWNQNDLSKGGNVYYREIFDGRLVDRAKSEVLYQFDRSIQVSSIILITWEKMQPREGELLPNENTNTFQIAIINAGNQTFVNIIYKNIGWTQGAEAGFSKGTANEYYSLPTSGTANVMFLKDYGNTGIPGEWMFQVEWHRIIRCKAGVKGDTCDTECSKNEWGEDCEQCCMCKTGNCNAVTGECRNEECETCWTNAPFCNYYDTAKCPPKGTKKCATYAISMYEYSKCGAPVIRCQCMVGYKGDGEKCEDVNECEAENVCDPNADCLNVPGSYHCQCHEGYSGNGTICAKLKNESPKEAALVDEFKSTISSSVFTLSESTNISSSGLVTVNGILPLTPQDPLDRSGVQGFALFYSAIDLSVSPGIVSVQETSNGEMLTEASLMIGRHFPIIDFMAETVIMVAYENVTTAMTQEMVNTFLLVLIGGQDARTGERMTFADFVYEDVLWTENAKAAVMTPLHKDTLQLPGSGSDAIRLLSHYSNIHEPGQWLFRVDKAEVDFCTRQGLLPPYCEEPEKIPAAKLNEEKNPSDEETILIQTPVLHVQLITTVPQKENKESSTDTITTTTTTTASTSTTTTTTTTTTASTTARKASTVDRTKAPLITMPTTSTAFSRSHVFGTTMKPITSSSRMPVLVTAQTGKRTKPGSTFVNNDSTFDESDVDEIEEALDSPSQLAIIIPAAIVGIWLLLLIAIGLVVCCRRRMNKQRFRRRYEANYHFQPIGIPSFDHAHKRVPLPSSRGSFESVLTDYNGSMQNANAQYHQNGTFKLVRDTYAQPPSTKHQPYAYFGQPEKTRYSYTEKL
ncbi:EGF-like domain-containing protein, partial [Trichinella pseudospiralis]